MQKKIRILIVATILGLIALSLIQAYLIKNTYTLKKSAFLTETRKNISRVDDFSPLLDSLNDVWQDYFIDLLADYHKNSQKITPSKNEEMDQKVNLLKKLKLKTDSLNEDYVRLYNKEIAKKEFDFDLKFQKRVKTIIIIDSLKQDTIFSDLDSPMFHLIGDDFTLEDGHKISNSLWLTEHDYEDDDGNDILEKSFRLQFQTKDFMNIDGWERIVISRMLGIFSLAFFLFIFVFSLLYYSIKNLIKQKKIADVKTDFVNNITHELKTPLSTLTLATKMLSNDLVKNNPEMLNSTVHTIERQNKRLQKLIDQVLDNSLGYKEIKLKKEVLVIEDYLNTVLDDFLLSVKAKNVILKRNFSKNVSKDFLIDKFYFTTAIFNILENAVKYNNNEEILIEVKTDSTNKFKLMIIDNGIGIPKAKQKNLFEKFYRVDNKDIHNVKGLGLGLYYTNQIIQANEGTLSVKSSIGEGTTFIIEIPFK